MTIDKAKLKSVNVFNLVSKFTTDVEAVEKSFDELVSELKDRKIRAFSCTAITLDGDVIYQYSFDSNIFLFGLIGATEIMKENLIKEHLE